jgi:hypothetical protein
VALWPTISIFALGAGLNIEALSPDALCPPHEETRRAVAARLGSVELEGTWRASYVLVHRTQGDFVSLQLFDPDGALRLERQLPVRAGSCAALSGVIALVLERFFLKPEQLAAQEHEPVVAAPVAAPEPESSMSSQPAAPLPVLQPEQPRRADVLARTATSRPRLYRAGAELWASTAWLAPTLRVDRVLSGPYRVALSAGFDLRDHETAAFEGTVAVRRAPVALSVLRDFVLAPALVLSAGVDVLGLVEAASTSELAESGGGMRLVPGVGARVAFWLFPQSQVAPFAELTAGWLVGRAAPEFEVGKREVLAPPSLVFGLALGIVTPF